MIKSLGFFVDFVVSIDKWSFNNHKNIILLFLGYAVILAAAQPLNIVIVVFLSPNSTFVTVLLLRRAWHSSKVMPRPSSITIELLVLVYFYIENVASQ